MRATGAEVQNATPLVRALQQLGMPLYACQPPTGYKDTADAWVNTGALVNRMNIALALASDRMRGIAVDAVSAARRPTVAATSSTGSLNGDVSDSTRATIDKATTAGPDGRAHARLAGISETMMWSWKAANRESLHAIDVLGPVVFALTARYQRGIMISRRVFLKNGAFALVSVGFAPSFLARTAFAQSRVGPREAADRHLSARRRGRPQRRRAVRRRRVLPGAAEHRHRAAGRAARARPSTSTASSA